MKDEEESFISRLSGFPVLCAALALAISFAVPAGIVTDFL